MSKTQTISIPCPNCGRIYRLHTSLGVGKRIVTCGDNHSGTGCQKFFCIIWNPSMVFRSRVEMELVSIH